MSLYKPNFDILFVDTGIVYPYESKPTYDTGNYFQSTAVSGPPQTSVDLELGSKALVLQEKALDLESGLYSKSLDFQEKAFDAQIDFATQILKSEKSFSDAQLEVNREVALLSLDVQREIAIGTSDSDPIVNIQAPKGTDYAKFLPVAILAVIFWFYKR